MNVRRKSKGQEDMVKWVVVRLLHARRSWLTPCTIDRYVEFDFHRECKGMKYENVAKLTARLEEESDFDAMA